MKLHSWLVVTTLLLTSCGSDSANSLGPTDDGNNSINTQNPNRGLSGQLISVVGATPYALDIATGKVSSAHPDPSWNFHSEGLLNGREYHNLSKFGLTRTLGSEAGYVLGVNYCSSVIGCYVIFDQSFNRKREVILHDIETHPVISRNGKYVAVQSADTGGIYIEELSTLDRIRTVNAGTTGGRAISMSWGTDGVLYYTRWWSAESNLYAIYPDNPTEDGHYELGIPGGGLESLQWSVAGDKFIVARGNSELYAGEFKIGADGQKTIDNIHRVAYLSNNEFSGFRNPDFSPDGEWITVVVGKSDTPAIDDSSRRGWLVAIPADAKDIEIANSTTEEQQGPAFRVVTDSHNVIGETLSLQDRWFGGDEVFWAPQ